MKLLKFALSGLLAHYKLPYTNSSKLTYDIPSFTSIEGILGAILGFDKWDYHLKIKRDDLLIGIRINNKINKIMMTLNQIDFISPESYHDKKYGLIGQRTQIPMEHIFRPDYTIYISYKNNNPVYNNLADNILERKTVYPLYFGSAYCLAQFEDVKEVNFETVKLHNYENVLTVIPVCDSIDIDLSRENIIVLKENIPYQRDSDFTIKEYKKVLFNPSGNNAGLYCKGNFYKTEENEIIYLFGNDDKIS